jgi:two-component system sensor histidine kinase VicK
MDIQVNRLSSDKIVEILNLSQNATAIYTGDDIVIQMANNAMISIWGKNRGVIGQPLIQAVPELLGQPFIGMLQQVWRTGVDIEGQDTPAQLMLDGQLQTRYFDFAYRSIKNHAGATECILHTATDITEFRLNREAAARAVEQEEALNHEQNLNEELKAVNEELRLTQDSLQELNEELEERVANRTWALTESKKSLHIALAEQKEARKKLEDSLKQNRQLIQLLEASDELVIMTDLLGNVVYMSARTMALLGWTSLNGMNMLDALYDGEHAYARQVLPEIMANDQSTHEVRFWNRLTGEIIWVDLNIIKLTDTQSGQVTALATISPNITARKRQEFEMNALNDKLAAANAELAAAIEEQHAINEQLIHTNDKLFEYQHQLKDETSQKQVVIERLNASEQNLRNMVRQAPVGMCIIEGDPLYTVEVNDSFLEIIGKSREQMMSTPYWVVNAEAAPYYEPITTSVMLTGTTYHAKEHEVMLIRNGIEEVVHVDFVYEPMLDNNRKTFAIMIVAIDVTDKVLARRKIEHAEESLRLATEAAEMGTYSMNIRTHEFAASARTKQLFGFEADHDMTYQACMSQIREDYRDTVTSSVDAAVSQGHRFEMEYPVVGFTDGKERWIKGIGMVRHDSHGKDSIFTGIIIDVTEQKKDEQRKNDFIGMVSHELKTPLTSVNAYLQLLQSRARKTADTFTVGALDKSVVQVKKMTTMINGFLNVSRLESGKIQIDKQRFDMAALIKETEDESIVMFSTHRVIFAPVEPTFVFADRDKIGQVVTNFIGNAVKYSKVGSTINVACINVDGAAQVSVSDTGMGIKPQDLEHIFDRYYRADNNNHIAGFGLGLYLSAEIIQRHQGKIWAESEFGVGTTFYFTLPLHQA